MSMNRLAKKFMTGVLTASMVAGVMVAPVFADTTNQTADGTISVTGVKQGDTAVYYQILKRNDTTGAWELNGTYGSLTADNITDGISPEELNIITGALSGDGDAMMVDTAGTTLSATVDPGTYVVVITPGEDNTGVVYSPGIVVSSDYDTENRTNTVEATAKETAVTVSKTVDDTQRDVEMGEVVDFTITPVIPLFPKNYTAPVYEVSDALSAGLELADANDDGAVTSADITVNNVESSAYEITLNDKSGFTVKFKSDYLKGLTVAPTNVTITYKAKVTSTAPYSVNEMTNTATINFSNSPSDTTGKGTDTDKTNHYTFTIDGELNGDDWTEEQETYKELIKTAVDKDGNPVLSTVNEYTTSAGITTEASPLAGATFKLTGGNLGTAGKTYTTTDNGYITFNGLDADVEYRLEEVSAPAGYVKDQTTHTVKIEATYIKDAEGNDILDTYKVLIDNETAFEFKVENQGTADVKIVKENTTILTSLISNVKATGLPSTGGMGTTVFYVVGIILIAGASILLVTKRRMSAK